MDVNRKLISNTVYLFLDWFVLSLIGFLYWLIAGKTLLPEEYGILSTSINFAFILSGISFLGLNLTLMKLLPEYLSKKQNEKIVSLSRFSIKIVFLSNLVIALFILLFSDYLANWIKVPIQVVWISVLILFTTSFSGLFGTIIYGFQEMRKFFISDFFGQVVKIVTSLLLIFLGFRYFGPLLAFLLAFLLATIIRLKFSYPYFSCQVKETIEWKKIMFDYAFPAFASFLAWILFLNGQYVLLTILKNPQITGIFTVAMIPTSIVTTFPSVLNTALFPLISFLSSDKNSKKRQNYLIQLVFRYALFLSLPVAAILVIFSKQVILIFSTSKYLEASTLFPILTFGALTYGLGNIFHSSLYAIGKTKVHRNIVFLTTLSFITLAIPLASQFAGFGMALSYTLSVTLFTILSFFQIKRFLKLKLPLINSLKCILALLISISFFYLITKLTTNLLIEIFSTIIAGLIYLWTLALTKFYIKEDVRILEIFANKSPLFGKQILFLAKLLSKYI
mgnify:CR=1 FL=1